MNHSALAPAENNQDHPILVVDRKGKLGEVLVKELKSQALIVYVSENPPADLDNVIHIPFVKKNPSIPDNVYSYIFLIDEECEIVKDVAKVFIEKAQKDSSFLILAVGASYVDEKFLEDFTSSYEKAKIAVLGDIFQKDKIYDSISRINKFIIQIKISGKINIPDDGTNLTAPVYFEDAISGILETVFGEEGNEKIFYVLPKAKITLLSLAHIFKKINPEIKIDFVKEAKPEGKYPTFSLKGKYLLGDSYDLEKKIKKIELENIKIEKEQKKPVYKDKLRRSYGIRTIIFALLLLILLPFLTTVTSSLVGAGALLSLRESVTKSDLSASKTSAFLALNSFNIAEISSRALAYELSPLGFTQTLSLFSKNIDTGRDISEAALSLIDASDKMIAIFKGNSQNPSADFATAQAEIKNTLYIYEKNKQSGIVPKNITVKIDELTQIVSSTIDFWPDIFGFKGTRNYLVLFQNNMELRPGGGFIGSYAILTLNKGKIYSFKIYDVYDADGQLKGHVEPPYPIRRYLPSVHWYLRDSNFNVDFSKGAVASAIFLNSEMGQVVDGVVGVDLSFVKNILSAVGPIKVSDYNQTVTADNFFQLAQAHAEDNFFPGSTQKKDFLTAFYDALQVKINDSKNLPYLDFAQTLTSSINGKHILFAFNNINEQAVFSVNGWSSSLLQDSASNNSSINDFIGINEANLGGNKVNYYISRSMSQAAAITSDGKVNESLTAAFKNSAPKSLGAKGIYKNYLRFILPQGAILSGIEINGQTQKIVQAITDPTIYERKSFVPPSGFEVEKEDQEGKTIYGFLVEIGTQQLTTIKIDYTLAQKIDTDQPAISYKLKVFKQPGVDFLPYDFSLTFPSNLRVVKTDPDVKVGTQRATLTTQIEQDREVSVELATK
jgi:hypothetical protein